MNLAELGIGKAVTGAIARKVVEVGLHGISEQFDTNDVEKALKTALETAQAQAGELIPALNADRQDWWEKVFLSVFDRGIGLEELQKPFKESTKPDWFVLRESFERHPSIGSQTISPERLEKWLQCFTETYFEQTNTFIRYWAKQREYLKRLIISCEDVKFVGIDVSARESDRASQLLDIFVVPTVTVEASPFSTQPHVRTLEPLEHLTEQQTALWLEQQERFERQQGHSISAHAMLNGTRRRVVLLGNPGTGKTTLMRYLAVRMAKGEGQAIGLPKDETFFPILVYMRDWAKHPERSLLEQVNDFAVNTLQVSLPAGFLEHWMDGRAVLLLDGLDEVAEDATRAELVQKINCFLESHGQNWAVITSRPWGYRRDYFRTENYPHFELELFSEAQIQEFIEHWYASRCETTEQAQDMIRDLQDALKSKDRLQTLVKNPLLLTMVALIHRYQDTLPKRRYKLYDKAVETLLKSWDRKGKGELYGEFKHLDREDDLRRVMSQLARWIHEQYKTQSTESGTLIDETDLLTQLSQIIRREYPQVKPHHAEGEAKRFVAFIRDRAGLLNEYGRGRYAFVHKTFQEYLTAEAFLKEAEYEDDSEIIYSAIQTHLHQPHWREVLLLLIGQLQGKKAKKAIELVLKHESPYEKWIHRDLLFAGRCLTEDPEKLSNAASDLVSDILERLIALEVIEENKIGEKIKQELFDIFCWLKDTDFASRALDELKHFQTQINQWRFLHWQALLGEKDLVTQQHLISLKDEDGEVRYCAVFELIRLGNSSEIVIPVLLDLLKDDNEHVRHSAAFSLGLLGNSSEIVMSALIDLLNNDDMCFRAAVTLGELGNSSEPVISALLTLLKDEYEGVRDSAANALGKLGNSSEPVISALLTLLMDENDDVRSGAAFALEELGKSHSAIQSSLVHWIEQHEEFHDLGQALDTLWAICA